MIKREIRQVVSRWKRLAGLYFDKAAKETDPLGKKFYESSAMAIANCCADVEKLIKKSNEEN